MITPENFTEIICASLVLDSTVCQNLPAVEIVRNLLVVTDDVLKKFSNFEEVP